MTATSVRPGRIARLAARLPEPLRQRASRLPGALAPPVTAGSTTPRVAIIGSGFGGLGMAARLRQAGIDTFTIYEKASDLGGTWRDNSYPGAACDVPSHLYSLSFAPNPNWTRKFPEQHEILAYLEQVADQFSLRPHIRFDTEVAEARFEEADGTWTLTLGDGSIETADAVVAATGQLNRPYIPDIAGLDSFGGETFHSARWNHDLDLAGRDVAVIGVGASAIQFIPEVAKTAGSVTIYQRSSNYVGPKADGPLSDRTRMLLRTVPGLRRLYRFSIWARFDSRWFFLRTGSKLAAVGQRRFEDGLRPLVGDKLTEEALIPDYPLGCKRILIANNWYPTLLQPHVQVVTDPVDHIDASGVVAGDQHRAADVIIFGTGFQSTGFLTPMRVIGRDGRDLHRDWAEGAEAHLGITVSGYPNLFVLYGPNTNLGHNSIVFMLERQIAYSLTCIRTLIEDRLAWLDVRPEVQAASNRRLVEELSRMVWASGCHSWYKTASGKITNNWSGTTARYWARTAVPRLAEFERRPRSGSDRPAADRPFLAS